VTFFEGNEHTEVSKTARTATPKRQANRPLIVQKTPFARS
jgi:hypothetical protein